MKKSSDIWNKEFTAIFMVNFIYQIGSMMMNTIVPKYADTLGATATMVGLVSSSFAIAALVIRPFASPAFNSFSKKKLLLILLFGIDFVFVVYSFTESINILIIMRLLHGVCLGTFAPLALSMASNALPDDRQGSGIGMYSLGQAVGQAVGPSAGLWLAEKFGYSITFRIGAVIVAAAFVLCLFLKDTDNRREPYKIALNKILAKDAMHPSILMFFLTISYTCINAYIAIYGGLLNIENIGLYFTVYAISLLIIRPFSGKISDKYGFAAVMIPGIIFFAISFVITSLARSFAMMLAAAITAAFGIGICQPMIQTLSMSCVSKENRGVGANTNYFFTDAGSFIGPIIAGSIIDRIYVNTKDQIYAYSTMYLLMTIPLVIAFVYFIITKKKISQNIVKNQHIN